MLPKTEDFGNSTEGLSANWISLLKGTLPNLAVLKMLCLGLGSGNYCLF